MDFSNLFSVSIPFEQSHLFFPRIIHWLLAMMLLMIVVFQGVPYLRAVREGRKTLPFVGQPFDKIRFFGTIVLTVIYFLAMPAFGDLFPNTGYGFLFVSMPYMLVLSWLYLHDRDRRHLIAALANAVLSPIIAWYLLAQVFNISLP